MTLDADAELEFEEVGVAELGSADVPGDEEVAEARESETHAGALVEAAVVTFDADFAEEIVAHAAVG